MIAAALVKLKTERICTRHMEIHGEIFEQFVWRMWNKRQNQNLNQIWAIGRQNKVKNAPEASKNFLFCAIFMLTQSPGLESSN